MSREICIDDFTDEELEKISSELTIEQEPSKYAFFSEFKSLYLFEQKENKVIIPFSYNNNFPVPSSREVNKIKSNFIGSLREEQKQVKKEAIDILNKNRSVMISCFPGFGKTITAINLACKIGLKTLVICHRLVLIDQWIQGIQNFCSNYSVEILESKLEKINADFCIANAINIPKFSTDFFKEIGLVIVDEAHAIMAEKLSQCMRYIFPRYVIGLSATPYRSDGLDILIKLYFGQDTVIRKMKRAHIVYKIDTGFIPELVYNKMGKIDWSSILEQQAMNKDRNELIIKIVKLNPKNKFLILSKRVEQIKYLENRLLEELDNKETKQVYSLYGKKKDFDKSNCRVLIGTLQKCGTGFDYASLNALIVACDLQEKYVQNLGRIFREKGTLPIVFDLVDKNGILYKHYKEREKVYLDCGGIIKNFIIQN